MEHAFPTKPLNTDLVAVGGVVLARKGEPVTGQLLETIRSRGRKEAFSEVKLADSGVLSDIADVASDSLYAICFDTPSRVQVCVDAIAPAAMPVPVLEELVRMRSMDRYTYRHVLMTTLLSARMLIDIGLSQHDVAAGAFAALTHDFGKLRLPLQILQKESSLTAAELDALREHPVLGSLLLQYYTGTFGNNAVVALTHHERPDGSGYPLGCRLEDRLVKVISVNDMFDALISARPYRKKAFDIRGALEFLWDEAAAGTVDEYICRLLISYNRKSKPDPRDMRVHLSRRSHYPEENYYGTILEE